MILPSLQGMAAALAIGLTLGSGGGWFAARSHYAARHEAHIARLYQDAEAARKSAQAALDEAHTRAAAAQRESEVTYAHAREEIARSAAANRLLAARAGGLRDPGARACGERRVPPAATPAGQPAGAPAGSGLSASAAAVFPDAGPDPAGSGTTGAALSSEATEFLLEFARQADVAAAAAQEGHALALRWPWGCGTALAQRN